MGVRSKSAVQAASIRDARAAGLKYVTPEEPGISRRRAGTGFAYRYPDGRLVRDAATLARIRGLVIPPAWEDVWICESETGHLQAVGRDAKGRMQYRYHPAYRDARDFNKFNRMIAFGAVLPKIRRVVARDLARPDMSKRKLMAMVVRLLDRTCFRVGNNEYARKNESYGLTTLKDEHVEIKGPEIRFHFRAKSGVEQDVSLKDSRLAPLLKKSRDIEGDDLFQYLEEDGTSHPVQAADVNEYLRAAAGQNISAKDFRTWHGTVQMLMELSEAGPATSATDAKKRLSSAVKATAKRLGNRPATCRGYYIHPEVIESYMTSKLFTALEKAGAQRTFRGAESALLTLVSKVHRPRLAA
jgi:DNA topoisomerase-1